MTQEIHLTSNHKLSEKMEYAVGKLIEQKYRSFDEGHDACAYRDPAGRKCLVGHLIRDEDYIPEMEGTAANGFIEEYYPNTFSDIEVSMLRRLQRIHDSQPWSMIFTKQWFDDNERWQQLLKDAKVIEAAVEGV